jgi:hypothetical protein
VRYAWLFTPVFAMLLDGDESFASSVPAALVGTGGGGGSLGGGSGGCGGAFPQPGAPAAKRSLAKSGSFLDCTPTPDPYSQLAQAGAPRQSWPGGWPGSHPPAGAPGLHAGLLPHLQTPNPLAYSQLSPGGAWGGYSGPISYSPGSAPSYAALPPPSSAAPAVPAIKTEPPGKVPFTAQPQHVYVTGLNYNSIPAGEVRRPACSCGRRPGSSYRPGPHATWDCPLRYWQVFGCCPGFLPSGQRDPNQWSGDSLTPEARRAWVDLIRNKNLQVPVCDGAGSPPFDK